MITSRLPAEETLLGRIDPAEVVAFLQALIRARSDYPPGDTRQIMAVIADKLTSAGIVYELVARREEQQSLIAEIPGGATSPTLLYHAHADTVAAGSGTEWDHDPFGGVMADGRIYGRGAGDDKGSVAAQVMALVCLARAGVALKGRLQLAVVADEESGGHNIGRPQWHPVAAR
jgi:acetylornithine deacetylase/succinyl-diaminopimelate desuccinylase-like protein